MGDSDIYGADILLCYSIGLERWSTFVQRVKWIQLEKIVDFSHFNSELLFQSKQDKIKGLEVLKRPYFEDLELFIPITENQQ